MIRLPGFRAVAEEHMQRLRCFPFLMSTAMWRGDDSVNPSLRAQDMIQDIHRVLDRHPVVADDRRADIDRLCGEIRVLIDAGRIEDAMRAQHLAMSIIYQGNAAPE
jgi:hypothetical protein